MLVGDLGEFTLIDRLAARLHPARPDVWVGIGDDAAVIGSSGAGDLVFTIDTMVEGVHFRADTASPWQIGWKALAATVSDIGAMGAVPKVAIVSIAVPADTPVGMLAELYDGLSASGEFHRTDIVGGDTVRTDGPVVVTVAATGECATGQAVRRAGARPGDVVVVTGTLGDSAAGLALLTAAKGDITSFAKLVERHLQPTARLREGVLLAGAGATALIDISDGLVQDAGHLADASGVGIEIRLDQVPTSDALRAAGEVLGVNPGEWILAGGEDYELLATMNDESARAAQVRLSRDEGAPLAVIGAVVEGNGVRILDAAGKPLSVPEGWDHFAPPV